MNGRHALLPLGLGLAVTWEASASEGPSPEALVEAVRHGNLGLQAAREAAEADAAGPAQVTWPFPMIEVIPMPGPIAEGTPAGHLMLRQAVPWPDRLDAERQAREHQARASSHHVRSLELQLVAEARVVLARLRALHGREALLQAFQENVSLHRRLALERYSAGAGPLQAALALEVEELKVQDDLDSLYEERSSLEARLASLTGGPLDSMERTWSAPLPSPTPGASLPADHPLLEAAREAEAGQQSQARAATRMRRPELTIGLDVLLAPDASPAVMPAVGVTLPLWTGGVKARVREAEARARSWNLEARNRSLGLTEELEDGRRRLELVKARIDLHRDRLLPRARQAREAALSSYEAGTGGYLDLLEAERALLSAELGLVEAEAGEAALLARLAALAIPEEEVP